MAKKAGKRPTRKPAAKKGSGKMMPGMMKGHKTVFKKGMPPSHMM